MSMITSQKIKLTRDVIINQKQICRNQGVGDGNSGGEHSIPGLQLQEEMVQVEALSSPLWQIRVASVRELTWLRI